MKPLIQSKTFWLAVAQAIAGIYAVAIGVSPELATIGYIAVAKSVLDVIMRVLTVQPISGVAS